MIGALKRLFSRPEESPEAGEMEAALTRAKMEQRRAAESLSAELAAASFEGLFKQ